MPQHLYVPFKKQDITPAQKILLDYWIALEAEKKNELKVCYYGEKSLKSLPEHAIISVLLPGIPGKFPIISGAKEISSEILRHHASLSGHLRLVDGSRKVKVKPTLANDMNKVASVPNELLVPGIANRMIEDGLFDTFPSSLHFKMYFLETGPQARDLAASFYDALMSDPNSERWQIRVQYFHNDPSRLLPKLPPEETKNKKKKETTTLPQVLLNEPVIYPSFYNKAESRPKLNTQQIDTVLKQYNDYKSSRFHGLSGWLGLNGLFSSDESKATIKYFKSKQPVHSEQECYNYALRFVQKYPNHHLAQFLSPVLKDSLRNNDKDWIFKPEVVNQTSLGISN